MEMKRQKYVNISTKMGSRFYTFKSYEMIGLKDRAYIISPIG